jgi:hypothetical protein
LHIYFPMIASITSRGARILRSYTHLVNILDSAPAHLPDSHTAAGPGQKRMCSVCTNWAFPCPLTKRPRVESRLDNRFLREIRRFSDTSSSVAAVCGPDIGRVGKVKVLTHSRIYLKGALLYTHTCISGRRLTGCAAGEVLTEAAVVRFHSRRQHLRVSRGAENSVPGAMRTRKWHFIVWTVSIMPCWFVSLPTSRSLLPWRGLRLYIIAAENVSAPFLLQSCAPRGGCVSGKSWWFY